MRTDRIEGLTDGIFAIVMTLLVLELHVPQVTTELALGNALTELMPHFAAFALTFILLGIFWIGHHNQMNYIHKSDRAFLWLNMMFFMFISLIPFSAQQLGEYSFFRPAINFYAVNLIACGIALLSIWNHAVKHDLVNDVTPHFVKLVRVRVLIAPVLYIMAILVTTIPGDIAPKISLIFFLIPIFTYLFPGRIDKMFAR